MHLPNPAGNEWLALAHGVKHATVFAGGFVRRIKRKRFLQALNRNGPFAKPGVSQGKVSVGLNMIGTFIHDSLEHLDRLVELEIRQTLERRVKKLCVGEISIKVLEGRSFQKVFFQKPKLLPRH